MFEVLGSALLAAAETDSHTRMNDEHSEKHTEAGRTTFMFKKETKIQKKRGMSEIII